MSSSCADLYGPLTLVRATPFARPQTTLAQTLHLVLPPLQERITLYDARMAARFSRLTDESGMGGSGAGAGAGDGMDVDLGFDFMAFGSGEVAPVRCVGVQPGMLGESEY